MPQRRERYVENGDDLHLLNNTENPQNWQEIPSVIQLSCVPSVCVLPQVHILNKKSQCATWEFSLTRRQTSNLAFIYLALVTPKQKLHVSYVTNSWILIQSLCQLSLAAQVILPSLLIKQWDSVSFHWATFSNHKSLTANSTLNWNRQHPLWWMTVCVVSDSALANVFHTERQSVYLSIHFVCACKSLIDINHFCNGWSGSDEVFLLKILSKSNHSNVRKNEIFNLLRNQPVSSQRWRHFQSTRKLRWRWPTAS